MGYQRGDGRWADTDPVTLAASAARTANGQGAAVEVGAAGTVRLLMAVTAVAGTSPSATVTVETSHSGAGDWRSLGTFAAKTGVATERKNFGGCDRYVRATWAITGTTPSLTFAVAGEAV